MVGTAGDKLLERRNLIGLLEFGSDEQGGDADQLQLGGWDGFVPEVLIDEGDDREDGLGEHLEFLVQLGEPVDQLPSLLLTHTFLGLQVVADLEGMFFLQLQKGQILHQVFGHHLGVLDL